MAAEPAGRPVRIFKAARRLIDGHAAAGTRPTLIDWMHVGWGRHKFFASTDSVVAAYNWTDKNPDESDVAFMGETIRTFKAQFDEPWGLIAGQPPYLSIVAKEQVLGKTVYCRTARSKASRPFRRPISDRIRSGASSPGRVSSPVFAA